MASKVEILGGQLDGSVLSNAASESTLRELLEAIKKLENSVNKSGKTATKGSGSSAPDINTDPANAALNALSSGVDKAGKGLTSSIGSVGKSLSSAAGGLSKSLMNMAGLMINGSNNLSGFVGALGLIPGPVGKFASVVAAGVQVLESYQAEQRKAAMVGASFNNSLMEMRLAAAKSGMALSEYGDFIRANAQSIGGLGDTITDGAKKLAEVGDAVGKSNLDTEFMKLGYSSVEARKAAMKFSTELVKSDRVRSASANELASASLSYEKDLDLLAKQTGKSKDELRAFSEGLIKKGGALQFAFARMSPQVQAAMKSVMNTVGATMGEGAQTALTDLLSGAAAPSSEASAMFQAQMPGVVQAFKEMKDVANDTSLSDAERKAKTDSLMAKAQAEQLSFLQTEQGKFMMENKTRLSPAQRSFIEGLEANAKALSEQGIDINTATAADIERVTKAKRAEQERQAALDKGFNAFQAAITKLSSFFQQAFFGALAPRLEKLATWMGEAGNRLESMGIAVETITPVIGFIVDLLGTVLGFAFENIAAIAGKVWSGLTSLITPVMDLLRSLGILGDATEGTSGFLSGLMDAVITVTSVMVDILGGAIDFLAVIIKGAINGLTFLINVVKDVASWFGITSDAMKPLKDLGNEIVNGIRTIFSKEGAEAVVEGIKGMFNTLFGNIFSMLGKIPGLGKLGEIGNEMLAAADANKKAREEAAAQAKIQAEQREQATNAEIDSRQKQVAAATDNFKKNLASGQTELANRKQREKEDAESAERRKNSEKDKQIADAMERSRQAAISRMQELAGIKKPEAGGTAGGGTSGGGSYSGGAVPAGPPVTQDVQKNLDLIKSSLQKQGITDPKMIAATIGNVMKETGGKAVEENLNYGKTDNSRIRSIFGSRAAGKSDAELDDIKKDPSKMGEMMYGKDTKIGQSMGNTEPGDGFKYRGRGFIQLTGKSNYAAASKAVYGDDRLVKNPDMLNDPQVAADVSAWFMKKGQSAMAGKLGIDTGSMSQDQANQLATSVVAGRAIKRGEGGYLGGEVMAKVDKYASQYGGGTAVAGATPTSTTGAPKTVATGGTAPTGATAAASAVAQTPEQKAAAIAAEKAAAEKTAAEKSKTTPTPTAPAQVDVATLVDNLNTSIAMLVQLQAKAVQIADQQLRATKGLSKDAYTAV